MDYKNTVYDSVEIIESRIKEKLTVGEIAESVRYSKYHFMRLFREIVGDSVMEYITKRKLSLAGTALMETDEPVYEIALRFGYDSHEGFTRSFKSYMGVTPMDYRTYKMSAINQAKAKERNTMAYSKITDEIMRELNMFLVTAKKTAEYARKNHVALYKPFWDKIADKTDDMANKLMDVLSRIANISDAPDEITNSFILLKIIDDTAFEASLLAFNVNITIARAMPDQAELQKPLCERYNELAELIKLKTESIILFFSKLSLLIFEDMKKNAANLINEAVRKGKAAIDNIVNYPYVKEELNDIVMGLSSLTVDDINLPYIENCLSRLNIITFAVDIDLFRNPNAKSQFDGITVFIVHLTEAAEFFNTFMKTKNFSGSKCPENNYREDIAFHQNILLFYTKGEVYEKMQPLLDDERIVQFNVICDKINKTIQYTLSTDDVSAYTTIASQLDEIYTDMVTEADILKEYGCVILFLANEFKKLSERVARLAA